MKRPDSICLRGAALPLCLLGLFAASAAPLRADVKLDGIFTSGAVLQQGMRIPIYGTADEGEAVSVRIQDQEASTVAVNGKWEVEIGPLKGGPQQYQLTVTGNRRLTLHNVLIGEVWVCAGGANMQLPVMQSTGWGAAVAGAVNQPLRFLSLPREGAASPQDSVNRTFWIPSGSASVATFSAVGYHFGRTLHKHTNVPIGLISCNHFETTIESWISREALTASPTLEKSLEQRIAANDPRSPTVLYNSMVHPITRFGVRGVLWYHGEQSVIDAYDYRIALPALIADWRKRWNKPNLPFLIVQIAPFRPAVKVASESRSAELRESQFLAWRQTPNTALITTIDYGDPYNVKPEQKQPIGERLALAAEALVYGKKVEYMGPMFVSASFARNEATVTFDHIGGGLTKKGDELTGFFVAGPDHLFREAKATIKGDKVIASSDQVPVVEAVRYGWADFPTGNLTNVEGLPASPFRSDNYPTLTKPKVPPAADTKPDPTKPGPAKPAAPATPTPPATPAPAKTAPAAKI